MSAEDDEKTTKDEMRAMIYKGKKPAKPANEDTVFGTRNDSGQTFTVSESKKDD